jgi:hypothetical protein
MKDITRDVARPSKARSALSNNPRRLSGIDMRSRRGRRFKDIVDALVAEFGDTNPVALREVASLRFSLEETQADVVNGVARAREDLVRLSNLIARRETILRQASTPRDQTPDLATYLAAKRAEANS